MAALFQDALQAELKKKKICRFCLSQDHSKISNIYFRDTRIKSSAPLPIQIMAIASIEVFSNDGMPSYVCTDCINMFEYSYQFKQMCKKADNLLRQFPLTGIWPDNLDKPVLPIFSTPPKGTKATQVRTLPVSKTPVYIDSLPMPKKILNTAHKAANTNDGKAAGTSNQSDQGTTIITKIEKLDSDCTITFLEKIENNEELSIDDIQQLMASEDINEAEEENMETSTVLETTNSPKKPKLLNKSSIRILNKNAEQGTEPRLSVPTIKQNAYGKTEIIAEILNEDDVYEGEPDPTNAVPIETNIYPCPKCERSFPLLQLRDLHMKNHTRDRKFRCEYCEKSFFSKYDLHRHSYIHNGEKPYQCSICDKAFTRSSLLTRHEKTHTDVPKHICVHCERAFISKEDLERHAEKHNINRPFICKICNKAFAFKQGLERHEIVHSRQQPFPCQYCSESFSTTSKLARHLTAHAGRRPYPCKFCRKSYLLSHHLTRHLRSHKTGGDPSIVVSFPCMVCHENFESREKLIKHSSTHADEMNLSCPLCKDVFDTMGTLVSHIEEHSSGELFACEFCDFIFTSADKLQAHVDADHANEMEAYHADDRAQANKQKEDIKREQSDDADVTDARLQNSIDEFLEDSKTTEETDSQQQNSLLKKNIKNENKSPKVINQIIIQSANNKDEIATKSGSSLLIPMKQRKLNMAVDKAPTTQSETPPPTAKQSAQLKRKIPNNSGVAANTRESSQRSIDSMFKLPKNAKIITTKPPPNRATQAKLSPSGPSTSKITPPKVLPTEKQIKTESLPTPKSVKVEKPDPIESSTSAAAADSNDKAQIEKRKGRVQKITVTKAQAAAMAKEGRIKIKDGKIILKT